MQHSDYFPDSFHRVTIKGLCVRDGKILLIKESEEMSGKWELPGGGLDFGENIQEAFKREVQEEMGLNVTKMSKNPVYAWSHRYEANARNIGWYYSFLVGYRIELENLNFTPSRECQVVQFFSKEELGTIELNGQTKELLDFFNPEDFKEEF